MTIQSYEEVCAERDALREQLDIEQQAHALDKLSMSALREQINNDAIYYSQHIESCDLEIVALREQARELAATLSNLYAEVMMNPKQSGTSRLARHHAEQALNKYHGGN